MIKNYENLMKEENRVIVVFKIKIMMVVVVISVVGPGRLAGCSSEYSVEGMRNSPNG